MPHALVFSNVRMRRVNVRAVLPDAGFATDVPARERL